MKAITSILLNDAYAEGPDPRPRLKLIDNQTSITNAGASTGTPPLVPSIRNTFLGWDTKRLTKFLQESDTKAVSLDYFFVADSQTADDRTLLLVTVQDEMTIVRLDVEKIPLRFLHREIWGDSLKGLQSLAGDDGVCRWIPSLFYIDQLPVGAWDNA